jgi:hypothetical protein
MIDEQRRVARRIDVEDAPRDRLAVGDEPELVLLARRRRR